VGLPKVFSVNTANLHSWGTMQRLFLYPDRGSYVEVFPTKGLGDGPLCFPPFFTSIYCDFLSQFPVSPILFVFFFVLGLGNHVPFRLVVCWRPLPHRSISPDFLFEMEHLVRPDPFLFCTPDDLIVLNYLTVRPLFFFSPPTFSGTIVPSFPPFFPFWCL